MIQIQFTFTIQRMSMEQENSWSSWPAARTPAPPQPVAAAWVVSQSKRVETAKLYIFWACTALGILVNLCIIVLIFCWRKYRRPTNYLIAYLAATSVFAMILTGIHAYEPVKGVKWFGIPYFCEVSTFIRRVPHPAMAFTTVAIVLDRKRFTRNLLARPTGWYYVRTILLITALALVLSVPRFFERRYDPDFVHPTRTKCKKVLISGSEWLTIVYNVIHLCCTHLGPAGVLLREIWSSRGTIRCLFFTTDRHFVLSDKRAQLIITVCGFAAGFLLFWPQHGLFYFAVNLPTSLTGFQVKRMLESCWYYSRALYYAYTATNPTLLLVLCYDWQWTTIIQLMRK